MPTRKTPTSHIVTDDNLLTGIEPIVIKAASGAAARAAGWGAEQLRSSRRSVKLRKLVGDVEAAGTALGNSENLTSEELASIGLFLQSPQFDHLAYSLARLLIIQKSGRKSDEAFRAIKGELQASLNIIISTASAADLLSETIFAALLHAVGAQTDICLAHQQTPRVQAETLKIVASIAAASTRNTELLRDSTQIARYLSFEQDLRQQISSLHGTMRIPHAGTTRQVPYDQLFIPPHLSFSSSATSRQAPDGIELKDLLKYSTRSIILGDPGGGKSTLALKLAYDIANSSIPDVMARLPLLVVLRDFAQQARGSDRVGILEYLHTLSQTPYAVTPPENALEYLLLNGRALVIFDGLDELLDTSLRRDVVQAVEGFAYRYPTTQIVVTSRRVGYEEAPLDSDLFPALQLRDLDTSQVTAYANNWFRLDEGQPITERKRLAASFLADSEFVADLRVNPLMLSLMCGIYATENYIPRNRPEVYEKCALLLFERWDKQRGIQVSLSFEMHVYAAMRSLALYMYSQEQPQLRRQDLVEFIKSYLLNKRFDDADVAESAAEEFIDYCKGRAWVLTDVGEEKYGFTHRTFLEYFSASQLVRLNPGAKQLFSSLSKRLCAREWDVVAQLALQILGRTVEDGADDFLSLTVEMANSVDLPAKANLLSFASRALQFIVPRPEVLRAIVTSSIRLLADSKSNRRDPDRSPGLRPSTQPATHLLGVSRELRSEVGKLARDSIALHLAEDWRKDELLAFAIVPWVLVQTSFEEAIRVEWADWESWSVDNWTLLREYMSLAASRYYWIDVWRLGRGEITADELIDRHGPSSLFDYYIAGYGPYPPVAYQLLRNNPRSLQLLALVPVVTAGQFSNITDSLTARLVKSQTPWLRFLNRYEILCAALKWSSSTLKIVPEQLILMLSAPLFEISQHIHFQSYEGDEFHATGIRRDRSTSQRADRLTAVLELRAREGVTEEEALTALGQVNLSAEAKSVLLQWVLGRVNFVRIASATRSRKSSN